MFRYFIFLTKHNTWRLFLLNFFNNHKNFSDLEYKLIPSKRSKKNLLVFRGNTFSQNLSSGNWYCSKYHKDCKAKIHLDTNGKIVRFNDNHNHEPPKMYVTSTGDYYVLS